MNMKKIISLAAALSITAACGISAFAADKEKGEPDVIVDGSKIIFDDQNATIVNDITLVPARGVFEAMGCSVDWNGDTRTVEVTSSTGVKSVIITIDSDVMKISRFKTLFEREESEYTLEVPAQIINERTMIPLRAVSEAFDCNVEWDGDAYTVNITTGDPILLDGYTYTAPDADSLVSMSLSTDKTGALEAGEEFTVYINAANIPEGSFVSSVTATFVYDKSKFEYIADSGSFINDNDEPYAAGLYVENTDYDKGTKVVFVTIDDTKGRKTDGYVYKATFKSVNGESGTIALGNDFKSIIGYESSIMCTVGTTDKTYRGKELNLDTTPLAIGE